MAEEKEIDRKTDPVEESTQKQDDPEIPQPTPEVPQPTPEVPQPTPEALKATPLQSLMEGTDVFLMLYPKNINGYFFNSIKPEDEIAVYEALKEKKVKSKKLLIFLDTSGGSVYSAVKIMDTLRSQYEEITIAIPQEAKSSGTMMCCGADKLIMGSISELGPLDKPMIHPDDETSQISALDIIKSIDGMIDTAVSREKDLADELTKDKGIPINTSLELASESISKLISPMLCREDVKIYNQAKRLLAIAETYCSELLNKHMLKYVKDSDLRERMSLAITRRLVWLYPDHGFAIRRNELREWFFKVKDAENFDFWEELWGIYRKNIDNNKSKTIKFI